MLAQSRGLNGSEDAGKGHMQDPATKKRKGGKDSMAGKSSKVRLSVGASQQHDSAMSHGDFLPEGANREQQRRWMSVSGVQDDAAPKRRQPGPGPEHAPTGPVLAKAEDLPLPPRQEAPEEPSSKDKPKASSSGKDKAAIPRWLKLGPSAFHLVLSLRVADVWQQTGSVVAYRDRLRESTNVHMG